MKKLMLTLATFMTLSAPSFADEISVMFQPDGGATTDPFGVEFDEDTDGTTLMIVRGNDGLDQNLFETIEKEVKNGISGSITAIFSWELSPTQRRNARERVLFFGDSTRDGRYFLWGYTNSHQLIRWYIPKRTTDL